MRPKKILLLFLLIITQINCQKKIDSCKSIIENTSDKKLKLAILDSVFHSYKNTNEIESIHYAEQYVNLAFEMKEYEKGIKRSIDVHSLITDKLKQPKRAFQLIVKSEKYLNKTNNTFLNGSVYLKKGATYFNRGDFIKAVKNYSHAITKYGSNDSIYKADAIYFRGQSYFETGAFFKCITDYLLASKYYENLGDQKFFMRAMQGVINVYGISGFTEKAIEESNKLITKTIKLNLSKEFLSILYFNQSNFYKKTNNFEKQEKTLLKAYHYRFFFMNADYNYIIESSLSKLYSNTDLKKSKQFLQEAAVIQKNSTKNRNGFQEFRTAKANYLFKTGKINKAIEIYLSCLKVAEKKGDYMNVISINKNLYEVYKAKKDFKNSLKYFQFYNTGKDAIFNLKKTNAISYYQTLYETEKKESEILKHKSDIKVLAAKNEVKIQWMLFGGIGLILIFGVSFLYRNRVYHKNKNKLKTFFTQNLLVSQDKDRKRISKDLHDSLGQSLMLIKNNISNENKNAKDLLNGAIEEIRTISRKLHPYQLKEIGITSAINNLVSQLNKNYPNIYIFGDIDNIDGILTNDQELNLYRIVQECFSNIIKHAKAKSAKIHLEKIQNKIILVLQDNGIGFDFSKKLKNPQSTGLKTIKERIRFINGNLFVETNDKIGSKFKITIHTV
jgi:signal transduction histidine kinase